jgi:AcrR family transcriptional regulator
LARDTHARIIAGARAFFFALGYDGTRLERLAEKLGITKKTIYNHFGSKEDLLFAVLDEDLREWIAETRGIVREPGLEMGERFLRLQRRAVEGLQRRATLVSEEHEGGLRGRMRTRVVSQVVGEMASLFAEVVELAKRSGYLLPDVNAQLLAHVLINSGAGVAHYCALASVPFDAATLLQESVALSLQGCLTDLGRERFQQIEREREGGSE